MESLVALEAQCLEILHSEMPNNAKVQKLMKFLKEARLHFDWVGIYMMDNASQQLVLGPFAGAATEHTKIPFGKGICGQVAVSGTALNIPDVNASDNYLACSIETKSELVMPIYHRGKLIGQLDIDSHQYNTFTPEIEDFCKKLCSQLGEYLIS